MGVYLLHDKLVRPAVQVQQTHAIFQKADICFDSPPHMVYPGQIRNRKLITGKIRQERFILPGIQQEAHSAARHGVYVREHRAFEIPARDSGAWAVRLALFTPCLEENPAFLLRFVGLPGGDGRGQSRFTKTAISAFISSSRTSSARLPSTLKSTSPIPPRWAALPPKHEKPLKPCFPNRS